MDEKIIYQATFPRFHSEVGFYDEIFSGELKFQVKLKDLLAFNLPLFVPSSESSVYCAVIIFCEIYEPPSHQPTVVIKGAYSFVEY